LRGAEIISKLNWKNREEQPNMKPWNGTKTAILTLAMIGLFAAGYAAGQRRVATPHTIIHMVVVKWRPDTSASDHQKVLRDLKETLAKIPGVRNVWLKADRVQPRDFSTAYAIEFENRDAADRYAESPAHEAWEKEYVPLREESLSIQVTNP
jgi:Stress responsive A/B Barrel Domain